MTSTSGRPLTDYQLTRIVMLLSGTDMSFGEIAQRMECSRSAIASVNRKYAIRHYDGQRSRWRIEKPQNERIDDTSPIRSLRRPA